VDVGVVQGDGEETLVVLHAADSATLGIGLGFGRWSGDSEPLDPSHWLPPPIYGTCDGGPPAVLGLDAPDQGASQGPSGCWSILVGDQPNK
jgi:hypothetical protein